MSNNSDVESAGQRISPPPGRSVSRYGNGTHTPPTPFYNDPITLEKTHKPWLVPTIVVVEIIVFIFEMVVNNCPGHDSAYGSCMAKFLGRVSFQPWKENPLLGPSSNTLRKMGALDWDRVVHQNQGWRLVSSMWLHAGLIHLLANMICLIFIGVRLEQQFGFLRVAPIYLISGFGGSVLSALFIQNNISVGASGALFGILGAMIAELLTNWTIYTNRVAALFNILVIAIINLVIGILPHVDNFAHIGGFLAGFLLGFILLFEPQYEWVKSRGRASVSKYAIYQLILAGVAALFLAGGISLILSYNIIEQINIKFDAPAKSVQELYYLMIFLI
ncbi:inactive rhomboid protein 1-like protein [Carex littledalei]|uniref:RHOMBOID-like protein n=1 Tax=Carex littledalei TaxID=544730 RepID=A0A833VE93_9POAL|nr:inactive rhomboid protein 1-like protein [Carex littledalei]